MPCAARAAKMRERRLFSAVADARISRSPRQTSATRKAFVLVVRDMSNAPRARDAPVEADLGRGSSSGESASPMRKRYAPRRVVSIAVGEVHEVVERLAAHVPRNGISDGARRDLG